jgi:transcriptional regulator with XRE-family HTH domain
MDLREYLESRRLTQAEFARMVRITPVTLSYYLFGRRKPLLEIAMRIEKATNGKVTMQDMLDNWTNRRKKNATR